MAISSGVSWSFTTARLRLYDSFLTLRNRSASYRVICSFQEDSYLVERKMINLISILLFLLLIKLLLRKLALEQLLAHTITAILTNIAPSYTHFSLCFQLSNLAASIPNYIILANSLIAIPLMCLHSLLFVSVLCIC